MPDARTNYDKLTAAIVEQLEAGTAPWVRPWSTLGVSDRPANYVTKQPYNGSNVLALWMAQTLAGYETGEWLTFNQARALGACVRKGEHGTPIVFAQTLARRDDDEEEARRPGFVLRGWTVFNVAQVEGLPVVERHVAAPFEALADADALIAAIGANVTYGGDAAFYSPLTDAIRVPKREAFESAGAFYATVLHEHAHWTGAKSRLDRTFGKRFGDDAYAFEELVAELTAAFLTARSRHPRHVAAPRVPGALGQGAARRQKRALDRGERRDQSDPLSAPARRRRARSTGGCVMAWRCLGSGLCPGCSTCDPMRPFPNAAIATAVARAAVATVDPDDTRFTTQAGSPVVINSTGADLLDANPEDDDVCAFVQTAKVGDECTFGGGAQPAITLVRVA